MSLSLDSKLHTLWPLKPYYPLGASDMSLSFKTFEKEATTSPFTVG